MAEHISDANKHTMTMIGRDPFSRASSEILELQAIPVTRSSSSSYSHKLNNPQHHNPHLML